MTERRVLIVDDDQEIRILLKEILTDEGYLPTAVSSGTEAIEQISRMSFDGILLDIQLGNEYGVDLIPKFLKISPQSKIIVMTSFGSVDRVVESLDLGATGFVSKAEHPNLIVKELNRRLHVSAAAESFTLIDICSEVGMVGDSACFRSMIEQIAQIKDVDATVLIQGESGTGKEMVARAIHQCSHRGSKPFDAINCGAIPHHLLESELFGHNKGAFTDAKTSKRGLFAINSEGTLLLDEIGELSLELQVKLLRVLQEKEVRPIGAEKSFKVATRVICATNRDLASQVEQGRFRQDLFYRISVIPITVPALRDRGDDIPILVDHYIQHFSKLFNKKVESPSKATMARLQIYRWPGNIRELQNTIERAVVLSRDGGLDFELTKVNLEKSANEQLPLSYAPLDFRQAKEQFEVQFLRRALSLAKGNISEAAKLSGIFRSDIYRLMDRHKIWPDEFKASGRDMFE